MANRSYLYALDFDPSTRKKTDADKIVSVGEWNYHTPISFRLLLSGSPKAVPSLIFEYEHPIALLGEFSPGIERLNRFLEDPRLREHYDEKYLSNCLSFTRDFLKEVGGHRWFLLECGELYDMDARPLEEQNLEMLNMLGDPDNCIAEFYQYLQNDPDNKPYYLGLDNWSNVLYFGFD